MTVDRPKTLIRALVGVLSLGVMLAPVLVSSSGTAASQDPKYRKVSAPNVFYPVRGSKAVKDRKTYSRRHRGRREVEAARRLGNRPVVDDADEAVEEARIHMQ